MSENKAVTPDNLNSVMEFGHVIRVHTDGRVTDSPLDPYIELATFQESEGSWEDEFYIADGWSLLTGFSGQHGYSGPVMHSSEYIGGGMAQHILETPGDYVALVVEAHCDLRGTDCATLGLLFCDCEPAGWAVAFKPLDEV